LKNIASNTLYQIYEQKFLNPNLKFRLKTKAE